LVDYYRYAKSELKYLDYKRVKSDASQQRHEQREVRLLKLKQARVAKRKRTRCRTSDPDKMKQDLQATLDRVKKSKQIKATVDDDTNENKQ
jgi:Na+-translocating ferredoxin:NAD+ oxidoreductase RnfC subunit